MKINKFEEILAWQKSRLLANRVYDLFKDSKDYSFHDQIIRAVISIMNNIAEGFERDSDKDFKRFLYISKASCAEVRSMLYLGMDLKFITENEFNELYGLAMEISKMLSGFIKKLN